jgi:hypothetical protein
MLAATRFEAKPATPAGPACQADLAAKRLAASTVSLGTQRKTPTMSGIVAVKPSTARVSTEKHMTIPDKRGRQCRSGSFLGPLFSELHDTAQGVRLARAGLACAASGTGASSRPGELRGGTVYKGPGRRSAEGANASKVCPMSCIR